MKNAFEHAITAFQSRTAILIVITIVAASVILPSIAGAISPTMTVTFYENDSGSDPVSAWQISPQYTAADLTEFADLSPSFSNAGYTFTGWNTAANGSGISYSDGEEYSFASNLSLYAQWTAVPVVSTVTFFENDNGSDPVSTFQVSPQNTAADLTSFADLSPSFSNAGYTFTGWNTAANGSGTSYTDGEEYSFASNLSLYAQWSHQSVTVAFESNGGDGSLSPLSGVIGGTVTLPGASSLDDPGYTLASWNTLANGSGASYQPGEVLTLSASTTLYAQWTPATPGASAPSSTSSSLSVKFIADGGSGALTVLTGTNGSTVTLPTSATLIRVGYTLTSWNTEVDGKGASYAPGASISLSSSLTLYAQWTPSGQPVLYGAIGDFAKDSSDLSLALKRQVRALASAVKSKKYTKVRLYGYSPAMVPSSVAESLSAQRAAVVARYLRDDLRSMKVTGVSVGSAGEGSAGTGASAVNSRVEVFVS